MVRYRKTSYFLGHQRCPVGTDVGAVACRYSAGSEAHILWGAGLRAPGQAAELQARLQAAGLPTLDVSAVEAAQVRRRRCAGRAAAARLPVQGQCIRVVQGSACQLHACTASHGSVRLWLSVRGRCRNVGDISASMHVEVAEHAVLTHVRAGQVHLRHLVGGRARSFMGELPWERIFQVNGVRAAV